MAAKDLSNDRLDSRMGMLEEMIAKADTKDLPALNQTFQRLLDEHVRRDLSELEVQIKVNKKCIEEIEQLKKEIPNFEKDQ